MKGHRNCQGWRAWGDWAQAAVPATADEGEEVLKRTDTNSRIKRSQLSLFVKKLLAVLCKHTQHHDNPRSLFQIQTAAYSPVTQRKSFTGSLCETLLCRQEKACHIQLHQSDKASEETIITSDKFVFFETPIWLVISWENQHFPGGHMNFCILDRLFAFYTFTAASEWDWINNVSTCIMGLIGSGPLLRLTHKQKIDKGLH